jgi:hypothetical protein
VHIHHGRVLICVRQVPAKVLDHMSFGLTLHVSSYKRGEVEVRLSVKVELVFQHGVHGIAGSSLLRDLESGELGLGIVATAVGSEVGYGTA